MIISHSFGDGEIKLKKPTDPTPSEGLFLIVSSFDEQKGQWL